MMAIEDGVPPSVRLSTLLLDGATVNPIAALLEPTVPV